MVYLEANNENYLKSIVSTINSPTEDAPRVPSTLIHIEEEAVPMMRLARGDSDSDLDTLNGPPKHAAPAPPSVAITPRTSTLHANNYENIPKDSRKKNAVSNLGYVPVYNKK